MVWERPDPGGTKAAAPPKQVALAMEKLTEAARIIADIRMGADRFLEALFVAASASPSARPVHLIHGEESSMQENLQKLRLIVYIGRIFSAFDIFGGREKLEASGVLNGSNRMRGSPWSLHMPLVCRDGSVVAYAWKRQLAGQAAASAVDRSRLPSYYIFAGLVFVPLTQPYLHEYGEDWYNSSPRRLCERALRDMPRKHGEQLVLLSQVRKVNDVEVEILKHLCGLVENCTDKRIRFDLDDDRVIVLNYKAKLAASEILKRHRIPSVMSNDLLDNQKSQGEI